ncbi:YagK/YfjJ domain-containing protein [Pseudomonas aeruginosa]|uniref:YagK/YfjJ domain-containing protein n=1 Tax=Pseudomonas aeruginosa TaxID=287 RepID=UPI0014194155|nr:inovirus-type Gp2 protein [Pseudomonas aeruginosa]
MKFYGEYEEKYSALLNKCATAYGEDGAFSAGGVDIGTILHLKRFSEMAKSFGESTGVAFKLESGVVARTCVGRRFSALTGMGPGTIDPVYKLEPYSQLIVDDVDWPTVTMLLREVDKWGGDIKVMSALNSIADRIRERVRSSNFKARLNSYHRSANKNYRELVRYERALFDRHSRMLVLRIDLSYRKQHCKVAQGTALQHRKRLFDNARSNKIFKHMLGYVTKLEHGMEKGFHFHCIFFFDGAMVREDITLARRIGEYWESVVTSGMGGYYNCNYAKELYRKCGIGMVEHSDMKMREGLRMAMVYVTKTDLFMKLRAEGRALTKGVMPSSPSGRGRPRAAS